MKHATFTSTLLLLAATAFAQNNVQLVPNGGVVCNPMQISLHVNGNSFHPVSYLWSTGETTPTISISSSGTYTLTVTGHHGNSSNMTTITKTANYNVLPEPLITALTDLWVCKGDTVKLQAATSGYDSYVWSTGATGMNFEKKMNNIGTPGFPALDTMSVSYTASISGLCSTTSSPVLLRSIRKPAGVGRAYNGRMNISLSDSIPAGLVLEYLYPVSYEMSFTDLSNPLLVQKYVTAPGSRKAPASMLEAGKSYSVVTTPVINGVKYCSGAASTIGIAAPARLALNAPDDDQSIKTFRVFDISGRLLMEKQSEKFNTEWLKDLTPQIFVVQRIGKTTEVFKTQMVR